MFPASCYKMVKNISGFQLKVIIKCDYILISSMSYHTDNAHNN